jgi:hypothetical protein
MNIYFNIYKWFNYYEHYNLIICINECQSLLDYCDIIIDMLCDVCYMIINTYIIEDLILTLVYLLN